MPDEYFLIGAKRWIRRHVSAARMRRADGGAIPSRADELRLFMVVRNETLRLPYFFDYYRRMGVERFFIVDNASDDGTREFLLAQPDTHVWMTRETYTRQEAWVDALLRRHGADRWCVVVDVDELLVYPHMDRVPLRALCGYLDERDFTALYAVLIDMYPDAPLRDARYRAGDPFLPSAPFFDPASFEKRPFGFRHCVTPFSFRFTGGVRRRIFGLNDVCCTKFPLVKFRRGLFLRQGTHAVEGARVADVMAGLLHFKYLSDFGPRVKYEAVRGEHWAGATQYKAYARKVEEDGALSFMDAASVRYEGPEQLLRLGLLQHGGDYDAWAAAQGGTE